MKIINLALFSLCLVPCLANMEQDRSDKQKDISSEKTVEQKLTLTLLGENPATPEISQNASVNFQFRNEGTTPIYILDYFEVNGKPFFIGITIHDSKGKKILNYMNLCKVERQVAQKYILLKPAASYRIPFPFAKVISEKFPDGLAKGEYTVTARYENQMGDNCFTGTLVSEPRKFTVED